MKNTTMRKLAGIAAIVTLASCMMAPMGMTAFAVAADTSDITISGAVTGSEYVGYKLMTLTQNGTSFSYTINSKYSEILQAAADVDSDDAVLEYLESDDVDIRAFADAVYMGILADGTIESDEVLSATEATTVEQGYYLVVETKTGNSDPDDTYSLAMLDTAGDDNVTITTKESTPTLFKKIKDKNDTENTTSDWQDSADHDIGDSIDFQLTGTVSSKYDDYKEYYYAFHDTLSPGLTFNNDVQVYVGGVEITEGFEVVTSTTDGCTFEVVFEDLKDIDSVTATSKIVVEYSATLNENAEIGSTGNPNVADLEYNVNPYFTDANNDGKDDTTGEEEETGYTPEDKVIAFTYKVEVNKTDGTNALDGATFTLEKNVNGTWTALELVEADNGSTFTFTGLDDGDYRLTETEAPQNYNKLTDPIEFTVSAEHDVEEANPQLTALTGDTFTGNVTTGILSTEIVNESGSKLPSTGGIGTYIFYILGTILVAGAFILIVSKKRMSTEK